MNYLVFATPRTGSSLVTRSIAIKLNLENLGEYFNAPYGEPSTDHERLLNKLESNSTPHVLKVFPNNLNSKIIRYLANDYQVISLRRRNLFNQVLSWGLYIHTIETNETEFKPNSLVMDKGRVDEIKNQIFLFDLIEPRFKNITNLFYEDFQHDNNHIMKALGRNETLKKGSPNDYGLPIKNIFKNIDEIRMWCL